RRPVRDVPHAASAFVVAVGGREQALGAEMAGEGGAAARLARYAQSRLVQVQHVLDDGQAQPGAAAAARAAGGDAVEAFGEPGEVAGGDAVAGVADRVGRAVSAAPPAYRD